LSFDMPGSVVALTACGDYSQSKISEAIERQFSFLGGLEKFVSRGDVVLLKPNLISPRRRACATQTDPAVIIETARLLKDFGAKPFVGDSPAWGNVFSSVKALEMEEPLRKLDVPVRQLNRPLRCRIGKSTVGISSVALEADAVINLPKLKTHQQLVTTFAVKNMFGCVSGKKKAYWHFARGKKADSFCELLIGIFRFVNPAITIIDGVIAMDGPGPIRGRARPLGYLIGGTDPVACEVVCARLVNIEPDELPIIRTAKRMGYGCCAADKIEIAGDKFPQNVCMDFELPELIPIRFSLPHICRSICKQALLLAGLGRK